ncbi:MAG: DsbA family protein [Gemmatimonadaceae bacterium]
MSTHSLRITALALALATGAVGAACARSNDGGAKTPPSTAAGTATASAATLAATPARPATAAAGRAPDTVSARADRARIQGDSSAALWMVVVSDFQCPYCRIWHDSTYQALVDEYVKSGKVRMAYVNFPLPSHRNAWPSAETAMCSGVQGKFWAMHDRIFATQERWAGLADPMPFFDSLATSAGVDAARMRACVASHATRPLIQADYDRSAAAGINSTPSFIIGNRVVEGALPTDVFRRAIDAALAAKK